MAVRPNPYVGSGSVYSSRGLTPSSIMANGSSAIALPLAQMVGGIIESASYDPTTDVNAMNAKKIADDLRRQKDREIVARQQAAVFNDPTVSLGDIASSVYAYGGADPEEAAKTALLAQGVRGASGNMDDALTDSALWEVASGRGAGSTFPASTYATRKKPTAVMQDGQPQYVAAEDATGMAPVLNKSEQEGIMLSELAGSLSDVEQKRVVGAAPLSETILNYSGPNGEFGSGPASQIPTGPGYAAFTGQAQGTANDLRPAVRGQLQSQNIANQQFGNMLSMAEDIARRDPTTFGATGNFRRLAQNVGQQIANIRQMAPGSTLQDVFAEAQQRAASSGIQLFNPLQYDPNLSDIVTMSELLVFGAAEALANQQGRSVSDKDVNMFRSIVGDPTSWTASQEQFLSKMDLIRNVLNMKQEVIGGALGGNPQPAPGGQGAPPPRRIRIDAQGNIIQ